MNSNISFGRPGHCACCAAIPIPPANVNQPLRRPRGWRITRYLLPLLTLLALRFLSPAAHATACTDCTVSNAVLSVTLRGATGGIEVTDLETTHTWMQAVPTPPPVYTATGSVNNGVITATVTGGGKTYNVVITLGSGKSFDFTEWKSSAITNYTKLPPYPFMFASPTWTGPWYYVQNTGGEGVMINMAAQEVPIIGLGGWSGSQPWWGITNLTEAMMARLDTFRVTRQAAQNADDSIYAMTSATPMKINYSFYSTGGYVGLAKTYRNYLLDQIDPNRQQKLATRAVTQTNLNFLKNGTYAYFWDASTTTQSLATMLKNDVGLTQMISMVCINGDQYFADKNEYDTFNNLGWLGGLYRTPTPSLDKVCNIPDWVNGALILNYTAAYLYANKGNAWADMNSELKVPVWQYTDIPALLNPDGATGHYGPNLKVIYHDTLPQQVGPAFDGVGGGRYTETAENNLLGRQQILDVTRASGSPQHLLAGSGEGNSAWWTIGHLDYWEGAMDNAGYADINTYHPPIDHDTVEFGDQYCDLTSKNLNESIRVPLLALGFHDYVAEAWNWRNSTFVCDTLSWKKDLFNILYGAMPMWNIDTFLWNGTSNGNTNASKYIASYWKLLPVRTANGFAEMTSHGWFSKDPINFPTDRSIQHTDWDNQNYVIVNFDGADYKYTNTDGKDPNFGSIVIPSHGYAMLPDPVSQDCEGMGTPTGWTNSGATPNWDYTGVILDGHQSLLLPSTTGTAGSSTTIDFGDRPEVWVYFKLRLTAASQGTKTIGGLTQNGGLTLNQLFQVYTPGPLSGLLPSFGGAQTTAGFLPNTTYNVWLHYRKGTGSNGIVDIAFSASATKPTSGSQFAQSTTYTGVNNAGRLVLGTSVHTTFDIILDDIRVAHAEIGNVPAITSIPGTR